jgi:uncharacterized protein (TIGR02996 family)
MRTFSRTDGRSEKFWHVELKGTSFTVRSGTAGGKARTQKKTFAREFDARFEYDYLINEKLEQGYVETTNMGEVPPMRRALEAALVADPGDLGSHSAYADWLTEEGDPRGELIAVQLALEDANLSAPQRKKLQQREKALWKAHRADWLGRLASLIDDAGSTGVRIQFARGWIDNLEIDFLSDSVASRLAFEPCLRLLRRLRVSSWPLSFHEGEDEIHPETPEPLQEGDGPIDLLARSPYLSNVRVLALGDIDRFSETDSEPSWYNSYADLPFLPYTVWEWVSRIAQLQELYLSGFTASIGDLFRSQSLSRLRVLQIYHEDTYPLQTLAANSALGNLTHLSLRPRALDTDTETTPLITLKAVRHLLKSTYLPSLTHLRIQQAALGDAGCTAIVKSGILRRLRFLDLARGCITDKGAHTLARCPDLRNLQVLDLSRNALTDAGIQALRATGVTLRADDQHDADDTQYLYEGEME